MSSKSAAEEILGKTKNPVNKIKVITLKKRLRFSNFSIKTIEMPICFIKLFIKFLKSYTPLSSRGSLYRKKS